MVMRNIIEIDEDKCTGCGACIPGCPEGALQVIDGKARLVSGFMCDGLGACVGDCSEGAMKVVKKEAVEYDEKKAMVNIVKAGENTISAHLAHLKGHGQTEYYGQAIEYLKENNIDVLEEKKAYSGRCPGSEMMDYSEKEESVSTGDQPSQLRQWPVQLHLVSPNAPYFQGKDVVLSADCVGYALGNFHSKYLKGKGVAIACPKFDEGLEIYEQKITTMIDEAKINILTVMIMQVPCCQGLLQLVKTAVEKAKRKMSIKTIVVGIEGDILSEGWV